MSGLIESVNGPIAGISAQSTEDAAESRASSPTGEQKQSASPAKAAPAPQPESVKLDGDGPSPKVLIVEDTTELAEVIAYTLEQRNIISFRETHGERALAVYEAQEPDLVLLDIGLPDMTGWKLLEAIKERREGDHPPIVIISAHDDPANRLMGKLQGVHSYLIKPFTPDEVEAVVRVALAGGPGTGVGDAGATLEFKTEEELPEFVQKMIELSEAEVANAASEATEAVEDASPAASETENPPPADSE